MSIQIALGSTSQHKREALDRALSLHKMSATTVVHLFDVPSLVDPQPVGGEMAALGAENRARHALARCGDNVRYGIGVESAVELRRGTWLDVATVVIVERGIPRLRALATSVGLPIHTPDVEAALAAGVGTTTAGQQYAHRTGGSSTDWHREVTEGLYTRADQITGGIYAALIQVW